MNSVIFKKAYDETLVQLEEIRKGNITEHEFESSVNAVLNTCNSYFDDQRWLVTYYVSERIAGTNLPLEKFIEKNKSGNGRGRYKGFKEIEA